ncbi:Glycosyl transferases group 1 [Phyllobacterium sp. YR620]|uniref:glycosyltransferase family 4 protein n=1 Tax=Phyllobacterium sp. YR620 TaxID=1881066 RepID=UPI00087E19EF|nr:glycosyltransferase family 4 protein [Phyllobacterium sp. YR620]SDP81256.1 Glycosyl transferases group 1 [Phyllobacterium sp. YR620]
MKFAYFVRPHIGGTYTVFKQLREGLAPYGIEVCWMSMGQTEALKDPEWFPEFALGTSVSTDGLANERDQARALAAAIEAGGFDGVFINVLSDRIQTNIARYLPEAITRIMIVHNITAGTYAAAVAVRDHVHAAIGVSDRIQSDLVRTMGFDADHTFAIPHAAETRLSRLLNRTPRATEPLRLVFLGRVEDASKGVFWLADILDHLDASIHLTIAGDGPDLQALKLKLARHGKRVTFLGAVHPKEVHRVLLHQDVMIMPSRFEGFGLTLTEAMAVGCVPVVSRIRGVTDTIIDDGINGFLFQIGNSAEAARIITGIAANPEAAQLLSSAARDKAEHVFTLDAMARRYAEVIRNVTAAPPEIAPPLSFADWSFPKGLRPGLRTYIPTPIKNWLRVMRERT